ncbi:MAG TPA: YkgJ family cysteine cluster protein [Polyangiaceae bacterium]|jgi:hypothetical protein
MSHPPWKKNPARSELLALYTEIDALVASWTCPASTDCCHFGRTGREPYVHAVELAELEHAVQARPLKRSLPLVEARRCPLLGDDGRCRVYASRPFGCRTYFCDRAEGPGKWPRAEVGAIARKIADLSARAFPRDAGPRPLLKALALK